MPCNIHLLRTIIKKKKIEVKKAAENKTALAKRDRKRKNVGNIRERVEMGVG